MIDTNPVADLPATAHSDGGAAGSDDHPTADPRLTFDDLGVIEPIQRALARVGITHPFPIQALAIPIAVVGTDMIGQARTGTGKTLAFGISLLQRCVLPGDADYGELSHPGKPQALVVCPTRELAVQVAKDLEVASSVRTARVLTVYGGVGYEAQLDTLASGVDIVVGTPGRLLDLVDRGRLHLGHVRVLVLDEADEMLDMGFLPDVERLIAKTPRDRQTMLFSATMPAAVMALARSYLSHPVNVRAEAHDAQATVPDTTQFVYQAHDLDKPEIVGRILRATDRGKIMIFCKTKRAAQRLADELHDRGFSVAPIHGDLNQAARESALKRFRAGKVEVLVATDVAARGIDVTGVSHVINYECPEDEKHYVHRIGRTGRAGNSGLAVTLVDWADLTRWKSINTALDLGMDDPAETYSTSPHLYSDLGIEPGTPGRLKDAKPVGRGADHQRDSTHAREKDHRRGDHRVDAEQGARRERPASNRQRRRTRNGVEVGTPTGEKQGASSTMAPSAVAPEGSGEPRDAGEMRQRTRTRRRRSPAASPSEPTSTTAGQDA